MTHRNRRVSDEGLWGRRDQPLAREALLKRYERAAHFYASRHYAAGLEHEDLVIEAMAGMNRAIDSWDAARGTSLRAYLMLAAQRAGFTAVKQALRGQHS